MKKEKQHGYRLIKIKANRNCKFCGGKGYATHFIGGHQTLCECITNQIDVVEDVIK